VQANSTGVPLDQKVNKAEEPTYISTSIFFTSIPVFSSKSMKGSRSIDLCSKTLYYFSLIGAQDMESALKADALLTPVLCFKPNS